MEECKYALKIEDFPYRLCKLQHELPVGCNIIPTYEECQILKEYNINTSAGHPTDEGDDIVRYSLETRRVKDKEL